MHQMDINNDGFPDLISGGNKFGFPPQFGRLDASYGDVLINNGKGNFTRLDYDKTGLEIKGEVKDIVEVSSAGKKYLLFLVNNEYPVLYEIKGFAQPVSNKK